MNADARTAGGARPTLIVIAKEPRPGHSKTRLCPPCTPEQAARLAEAALADTLEAVAVTGAPRRLLVLEGMPGPWMPKGFDVVPQVAGGLEMRLAAAFEAAEGPALLVGMDTPQLTPELIERGGESLMGDGIQAVLGMAPDGGYWAIGLSAADPAIFDGIPMSTAWTGAAQRRRIERRGLELELLPELTDVDTFETAVAVASDCAPGSRFADEVQLVQAEHERSPLAVARR